MYSGLFPVSRQTRDGVLRSAPQLTVRLQPPSDSQSDSFSLTEWSVQLAAVVEALRTRGPQLPTRLVLAYPRTLLSSAALAAVTECLRDSATGIIGLRLEPTSDSVQDNQSITTFVVNAAQAFPNLSTLTLDSVRCTLPPPHLFPRLVSVSIKGIGSTWHPDNILQSHSSVRPSLVPYVPNLGSLSLTAKQQIPWGVLFTSQASNLVELNITETVTERVIDVLCSKAPALKQLRTTRGLAIQPGSGKDWEWELEALHFVGGEVGAVA